MPTAGDTVPFRLSKNYLVIFSCRSDDNLKVSESIGTKKSGLKPVTLNLQLQPRLPGSVVGEASMVQYGKANKITEGR
jgi:hypothetical protein